MQSWQSVLTPESLVVAGISGGADSVFLLLRLLEASRQSGWQLHAVHIHHHQRGLEADGDAEFVRQLTSELGVPCAILDIHPDQISGVEAEGGSLEARLREARLALLRAQAAVLGADAIALGHHAGDLAESFLLMALRGSGPTGLGSLREARFLQDEGVWLLRPLLSVSRAEIEADLLARGQAWREDATNRDPRFRRNRLRHEVVPLLEQIEPGTQKVLARSARLCAEESDLLAQIVSNELTKALISSLPRSVMLDASRLRGLEPAMATLVIRRAWARLGADQASHEDIIELAEPGNALPPPYALTKDLVRRIQSTEGEPASFGPAHGFFARVTNHDVLLSRESSPTVELLAAHSREMRRMILLPDPPRSLPVLNSTQRATPGRYELFLPAGAGKLEVDVISAEGFPAQWDAPEYAGQRAVAFDIRGLKKDLCLRPMDPREEFSISGGQKKEVGDVLQEARVPVELRPAVAGLADDRGLLWIPGVRRAAASLVTERTEMVVRIRWISQEEVEKTGV